MSISNQNKNSQFVLAQNSPVMLHIFKASSLHETTVGPPVANTPNRKFGPLPFWQTQWADPLHNNDSILE